MEAKINQKVLDILRRDENRGSLSTAVSTAISGNKSEPVVVKDQQGNDVTLLVQRTPVPSR